MASLPETFQCFDRSKLLPDDVGDDSLRLSANQLETIITNQVPELGSILCF
jgi:hypothetical protein